MKTYNPYDQLSPEDRSIVRGLIRSRYESCCDVDGNPLFSADELDAQVEANMNVQYAEGPNGEQPRRVTRIDGLFYLPAHSTERVTL